MSDTVIIVENLCKLYRLGELHRYTGSFRDKVTNVFSKFMPSIIKRSSMISNSRRSSSVDYSNKMHNPRFHYSLRNNFIWALRDVSFEVKQGEVLGIIGCNGAGKTTLLKILSRITRPTRGKAWINGRVGSLLEVGIGFHPELTGRENIYLNGAILGMKKAEIDLKFDEIVAFAELEKFIDTPVKRYSSGMYVRLAFAVAAHMQPEILLIDEVLAVGDAAFQKKCLGKIEDAAYGGRTVLFVSHNMGAISSLCKKAILLTDGCIEFAGPVDKTISKYLSDFIQYKVTEKEWAFEEAPGSNKVRLKSVSVASITGKKHFFPSNEPIKVTMEYWVLTQSFPINVGFWLADDKGNWIFAANNCKETRNKPIDKIGLYRSESMIPANLLNIGKYTITPVLTANLMERQARIDHCLAFETAVDRRTYSFEDTGIIKPECKWYNKKISDIVLRDNLIEAKE